MPTAAAATYTTYPTKADVELMFSSVGISLPATFDCGFYVYGAIDELEELTGYRPYLVGASAAYYFDPPGQNQTRVLKGGSRRFLLPQAFVTITEVRVYLTPTDSTGTVLTEGTDYTLKPLNRLTTTLPITEIEFNTPMWGVTKSIKITGTPGYGLSIKARIWNAVRSIAAGYAAHALREMLSQDAIEAKLGDESIRLSIELIQKYGDSWLADGRAVITSNIFVY